MSTLLDLDAFVTSREASWRRVEVLTRRRRLGADEADELVALYRQVATDLALVQSRAPEPFVTARLSRLLSQARAATVAVPPVAGWSALARGVLVDFPVTVYRTWRWSVGVAFVSLTVSALMMLWVRDHPSRVRNLIPSAEIRALVDRDFAGYYSAHPAQAFAAQVWTNNALVTAMAMVLGVTLVGTVYVLWTNTLNLGIVGGVMLGAGKGSLLFGLLLPHGMLELSAVFIACGVGLRTGWAWVAPGPLPRSRSLAQAGRAAVTVSLGLVAVLLVSGVLEAFVTPSGLPTWLRIGIGATVWVAFVSYVVVLGRRGVRAGAIGDLGVGERDDAAQVA